MYDDSFQAMIEECIAYNRDKICKLIEGWCKEAKVESPVGYYNESIERTITIYTDKPGCLVGVGGCLVNKFKEKLCEEFYVNEYKVEFVEICGGFANIK